MEKNRNAESFYNIKGKTMVFLHIHLTGTLLFSKKTHDNPNGKESGKIC